MWDTIVIGSGISGLVAAAALARTGHRVLGLEQHTVPGGLTQTFSRRDWTFSTGVHYLAGVGPHAGPDGQFGRLLGWLSDGHLQFADCGNPYDIVRLPGFEFGIEHPEARYRAALLARFPQQRAAIERWFDEMQAARGAAQALFVARSLPPWLATALRWWRGARIERWSARALADATSEVHDPALRAVLGARWGDYGAPPATAPLIEHALVTGAYNGGAWFPVGGPGRFAQTLMPAVEAAGGHWLTGATVERIVVTRGQVDGVEYRRDGVLQREPSARVISAMGVLNTALALGDEPAARDWQTAVRTFEPGLSYLSLFIGFEGELAAAGAAAANIWVYESDDVSRVWRRPADEDAPGLFVSFPSLKDPRAAEHPTAEVVALCDAGAFARWMHLPEGERPDDYKAYKARVAERLLAQFERHFPRLAPLLRFHELSTPLTQQHFTRAPGGAAYGIEMTHDRMVSTALDVRTPVRGLLLAGQDVFGAGVPAAAMSGLIAAAAVEPKLWERLRG